MRLIGSGRSIFRRSTRILSFSQISSARSVAVTEPKSVHVEAKLGLAEGLGDLLSVVEALRLVPGTLGVALLELGNARGSRLLGELPRAEVVAHVAARDGDDVAAQPDLLHVFQEDDVHDLARYVR